MTKRERVMAAVAGRAPDRVPLTFWRHVPEADHDPDLLAEAMIAFQRRFDLDLVKLMPSGMYGVEDYGCQAAEPDPITGAKRLVGEPASWERLEQPLPPEGGARGRELTCLRLVRRALGGGSAGGGSNGGGSAGGGDVPILQTVFSPSTTAAKAAGRDRLIALLRTDPARAHRVLAAVAKTERAFAAACLDAGADGIFFATQLAGDGLLTREEYGTFGVPYDQAVLKALSDRPHLSMLHLHGHDILFDLFPDYGMPLVNWHDRRTVPDLVEGRARLRRGAVAGGLDERGILFEGPADRIAEDVRSVIARTGGIRHVLAPGCVLPLGVPDAHLAAVRDAVEPRAPV